MDIRNYSSIFFQEAAKGIVLDNAYDVYTRNRYIEYAHKNHINYIFSQDVDMNMIGFFPCIEFLTVPEDAENIQALYELKKLKGLEIPARCLDELDLAKFESLEYLLVREKPKRISNLSRCKNLKHLYCNQWKIVDVDDLKCLKGLKSLTLEFCDRLQSLNGVEGLAVLEKISIIYCLKLRKIEGLGGIKDSLKCFIVEDCNKIEDWTTIKYLCNLERLFLSSFQTRVVNKIASLKFIEQMPKLKEFMTNYKIEDGDLTPLLKVEKVDILKFYRHYNLKENSFNK